MTNSSRESKPDESRQDVGQTAEGWAVVTGGGSGIGRAVALRLAHSHPAVAVLDKDERQGQETTQLLTQAGFTAIFVAVDVADAADVDRAFDALPDVAVASLVNCAGVREIRSFTELSPQEWAEVIAVNLSGTFYCIKSVYQRLLKPRGSIVNVSSVGGMIGVPGRVAYCASKHGVIGLTRALAHDLGAAGVRVNSVSPGVVETPMTASYFTDPDLAHRLRDRHPIGRWGQADEVAELVAFLCGPLAGFCSGGVYPVDGGFTASKSL